MAGARRFQMATAVGCLPPRQAGWNLAPYGHSSADGRHVAFRSDASNLVEGDPDGSPDVFVRDMQTGSTRYVSVGLSDGQANDYSWDPSISADGLHVAFASESSNLVEGDANSVVVLCVPPWGPASTRLS